MEMSSVITNCRYSTYNGTVVKKIIKEIFFNNIGLTCNFAELIIFARRFRAVDTGWG